MLKVFWIKTWNGGILTDRHCQMSWSWVWGSWVEPGSHQEWDHPRTGWTGTPHAGSVNKLNELLYDGHFLILFIIIYSVWFLHIADLFIGASCNVCTHVKMARGIHKHHLESVVEIGQWRLMMKETGTYFPVQIIKHWSRYKRNNNVPLLNLGFLPRLYHSQSGLWKLKGKKDYLLQWLWGFCWVMTILGFYCKLKILKAIRWSWWKIGLQLAGLDINIKFHFCHPLLIIFC